MSRNQKKKNKNTPQPSWWITALNYIVFSCVQLFMDPWTTDWQAPLPIGFSSQENWSGLPCPPPGDLPDLLHWQAGSLPLAPPGKPHWAGCGEGGLVLWFFFFFPTLNSEQGKPRLSNTNQNVKNWGKMTRQLKQGALSQAGAVVQDIQEEHA